ncbi:MAG: response regulator [Thermoanaerobaculia bacterium]
MKILIVDDEDDIRKVARLALSRLGGMEVVEASNGPDGIAAAAASKPDAILLDVMMPAMDGPAVLARLKGDAGTAVIPVVFLTAKAMASEITRLKSLGAAGVVTKPFDPTALADQIRAILAGR